MKKSFAVRIGRQLFSLNIFDAYDCCYIRSFRTDVFMARICTAIENELDEEVIRNVKGNSHE